MIELNISLFLQIMINNLWRISTKKEFIIICNNFQNNSMHISSFRVLINLLERWSIFLNNTIKHHVHHDTIPNITILKEKLLNIINITNIIKQSHVVTKSIVLSDLDFQLTSIDAPFH